LLQHLVESIVADVSNRRAVTSEISTDHDVRSPSAGQSIWE
jgi:hypothetical protein